MAGQLHVALIGEDASFGLAMMPEAYKVVVMKTKAWSEMNHPPALANVQVFCDFITEIVRLGMVKASAQQEYAKVPETDPMGDPIKNPPANPAGKRPRNEEPNSGQNPLQELNEDEMESRLAKKPRSKEEMMCARRVPEDKELTFVGNDGSVTKFVRLDVRARFTEEEIDEHYKIHRQRQRQSDFQ